MIYIEPLERERLYKEIEDLGKQLKIPIPQCFLELKVIDRAGRVIHHHRQRSHSWTRNAYNFVATNLMSVNTAGGYTDGNTSVKGTGGGVYSNPTIVNLARASVNDSYSVDPQSSGNGYVAPAGDNTHGIVAGIGAVAESFDDFAMSSICAEGTGANQLHYVLSEQPVTAWDAGTKTYSSTWKRYMNNNSPGDVTITNIGLIGKCSNGDVSSYTLMLARDVLSPSIVVPASGQVLASYFIGLVYP